MNLECFSRFGIRGCWSDQLNEGIVWRIGGAYARKFELQRVVIGRDVRLSSQVLSDALARGLADAGVDVFDIGHCGFEEVYHATQNQKLDGGIMVSAGHGDGDESSLKLIGADARPITALSDINDLRQLVRYGDFSPVALPGRITKTSFRDRYITDLLALVDPVPLRPLKIIINSMHGCAGPVIDLIAPHLSCEFVKLRHEPDCLAASAISHPLGLQNRMSTHRAILSHGADLGILLDGDFDRCFLFDEGGHFIDSYYTTGLLCEALLQQRPGEKVIHDACLFWNTVELVKRFGGTPLQGKLGQAFISEQLRKEDAIYGSDCNGHHYFRAFSGGASGMLAWLLIVSLLGRKDGPLSQVVEKMKHRYPVSGQISHKVDNPAAVIEKIWFTYEADAVACDFNDGISIDMGLWRFNLRCSRSGEMLRVNVEAHHSRDLLEEKTGELLRTIKACSAPLVSRV